jgi:hypothetical protein
LLHIKAPRKAAADTLLDCMSHLDGMLHTYCAGASLHDCFVAGRRMRGRWVLWEEMR